MDQNKTRQPTKTNPSQPSIYQTVKNNNSKGAFTVSRNNSYANHRSSLTVHDYQEFELP